MIRWAIGLFVAALIAALVGFGGIASTFAATAQIIFFVLLILFIVSAVVAMVGARAHGVHNAVRSLSLALIIATVSIGTYAWIENGMSAERLGRTIDHQTVSLGRELGEIFDGARLRTHAFMSSSIDDLRRATADDEASTSNTEHASRE